MKCSTFPPSRIWYALLTKFSRNLYKKYCVKHMEEPHGREMICLLWQFALYSPHVSDDRGQALDLSYFAVWCCLLTIYRGELDGASLQGALSVPAAALKTRDLPSLQRVAVVTLNINRCITNTSVNLPDLKHYQHMYVLMVSISVPGWAYVLSFPFWPISLLITPVCCTLWSLNTRRKDINDMLLTI